MTHAVSVIDVSVCCRQHRPRHVCTPPLDLLTVNTAEVLLTSPVVMATA